MLESTTRTPRILPVVDELVVEVVGWERMGWMRRRERRRVWGNMVWICCYNLKGMLERGEDVAMVAIDIVRLIYV
jgi:hypothetical protein